jgi:kinesin family protein 2/24
MELITECNNKRVTQATTKNSESSRSHSICHLYLRDPDRRMFSKLTMVDLAGSERDADSGAHAREQRTETANINKSLLALKECIRAKDERASHVPFRSSKLTLVLKDCFSSKPNNKLVVISAIAPSEDAADHTINTLKYSELIVSRKKKKKARGPYQAPAGGGEDVESKAQADHDEHHEVRGGGGWRKERGARYNDVVSVCVCDRHVSF